jgi:hypothetical protein
MPIIEKRWDGADTDEDERRREVVMALDRADERPMVMANTTGRTPRKISTAHSATRAP